MKIFLLYLLLTGAPARADILYLNKGDEINGLVTAMDAGSVTISAAGKETSYARGEVMKIQFVKEYSAVPVPPQEDPAIQRLLAAPPKPADYPNDGYLTWLDETAIDIRPDKTWTVTRRGIRSVLRERGKSPAAYRSYSFLPGLETAGINYAYSITDSTVSYLNDISVMEGSPYMNYPSYDRLRLAKYAIPNVQTGSTLVYSSSYSAVHSPEYPFFAEVPFRFSEPVKTARLVVTVPDGLELSYQELNLPKGTVFSKTSKDGNSVYVWEVSDLPSYRQEPHSPPFMRYVPQVALSLASSWEEVRAVMAPLLRERLVITPAMKAKAAELVSGKTGALQKAEALYNWTVKEIKFQPVDMAEYSYLPKPADETFSAKAGNALDKPFLLYALLDAAGLKPEFAYARSKDAPFTEKLPNIRRFDRAECLLTADGKELVLSPAEDTRRYFELQPELQGVKALRVLGSGEPLFDNPDHSSDQESETSSARYILDKDGNLSGSYSSRMTGSFQASMRSYKDYKKEDLDRDMEQYVHSIHPLARLKSYTLKNLGDLSKNLEFVFSMNAQGYAMKAGRYMIFKVPGLDYTSSDAAQTERELPLFWYSRSRNSRKLTITLPEGYRLYHAPKDLDIKLAGQSYSAGFRTSAGKLTFADDLKMDNTWVDPAVYPQYKAFREALAQFSENWVVLEKN